MKTLLDTHAFLWFIAGNERLSTGARRQIESSSNEIFVSIVSLWEIAIKSSLGKLTLAQPISELIPQQMERNGFHLLPITPEDAFRVAHLPFHHRDPFDRMLIAQTMNNRMRLVSSDSVFDLYLPDSQALRVW